MSKNYKIPHYHFGDGGAKMKAQRILNKIFLWKNETTKSPGHH